LQNDKNSSSVDENSGENARRGEWIRMLSLISHYQQIIHSSEFLISLQKLNSIFVFSVPF